MHAVRETEGTKAAAEPTRAARRAIFMVMVAVYYFN